MFGKFSAEGLYSTSIHNSLRISEDIIVILASDLFIFSHKLLLISFKELHLQF